MRIICVGFFFVIGCALPSFAVKAIVEPPAATFSGSRCAVRVESMGFAPDVRLGNQSEAEFIAGLNPEQQKSYAADKTDMQERYFENLKINERDYLKSKGHVTVGATGNEPFTVRSQVVLFDPKSGHLVAQHAILDAAQKKVGEFAVESEIGSWYGSGFRLRIATVAQAVTVLQYFADRFACSQ